MERAKRVVSDSHKEAMAAGRQNRRVIEEYLTLLTETAPKRGRKPDPAKMQQRLDEINATIDKCAILDRVQMAQERIDLQRRLTGVGDTADIEARLEAAKELFLKAVGPYSDSKNLTFAAWRAAGVPAAVLREAGL